MPIFANITNNNRLAEETYVTHFKQCTFEKKFCNE